METVFTIFIQRKSNFLRQNGRKQKKFAFFKKTVDKRKKLCYPYGRNLKGKEEVHNAYS